jgi:RNA polymerase sigma-70 factor (ECF subfamily)
MIASGTLMATNQTITLCLFEADASYDSRRTVESELVRRVQSGDQAAFRDLVERYQNKIFSIVYRLLRNRQDTEDIAQMVFTKVYFAIKSFDGRCSLLSWICRIAINECYSHLRKRRVRRAFEGDTREEGAPRGENRFGACPQPSADTRAAARDLVEKLLARVPEEDRLLLVLKEVEGHSVNELAEMTGASESAVKTRLFRARQKLVEAAGRLAQRPVLRTA